MLALHLKILCFTPNNVLNHITPLQVVTRVDRKDKTGAVSEERKPHFAVVGNSNGMIEVWTPTTVRPPSVTHKFKPISINPLLDAGAIVGTARIQQVDPVSGTSLLALLTASAKGSISLFRAYTWEPLHSVQVPNIPGGSNVQHDLVTAFYIYGYEA